MNRQLPKSGPDGAPLPREGSARTQTGHKPPARALKAANDNRPSLAWLVSQGLVLAPMVLLALGGFFLLTQMF